MSRRSSLGAGLWLDVQLAARLAGAGLAPGPELLPARAKLDSALRLWQWRHLCDTLMTASGQTRHYSRLFPKDMAREAVALAKADFDKEAPDRALVHLLAALPFTFASDIEAAPEDFLALGHSEVSGVISLPTSGTTGPGKRIFCSEQDLETTAAFFQQGMRYLVGPGKARHVALLMSGDRPGSVGDLLRRGLRGLGVSCSVPGFMLPGDDGEKTMLEHLLALGADCLVGVPGQILALARHRRASELAARVRGVLLSGDAVTPALRQGIEAGLGCEVFVHYGLTETGLGGAVECPEHDGLHLREADLLAEIVDNQGQALPQGEWGELTLSTLTRQAMPLLRYRTGDEARLECCACACGSVFRRIFVRGRMGESLDLPGDHRLHITDLDARLYSLPFVRGYQAVLHEPPDQPPCLTLGLRLEDPPADALEFASASLGDLPGLLLTPPGTGDAGAGLALRVCLDIAEKNDEDQRVTQAKQRFWRSSTALAPMRLFS
ncbi:AMP-binding protein [Desulfovibrio sp. OttesenSCG-928-F20]|nr:AMP-binding protein [Desulfovibrio sp. OttesenSCG-928-F20]